MTKTTKCTQENMHLFIEDLLLEVKLLRSSIETIINVPKAEHEKINSTIIEHENLPIFIEKIMLELQFLRSSVETIFNVPKMKDQNVNNPIVKYVELPTFEVKHCRLFDVPVLQCDLSVRTINVLKSLDISTIGELLKVSKKTLKKCRNFGNVSCKEIDEFLKHYNLSLE